MSIKILRRTCLAVSIVIASVGSLAHQSAALAQAKPQTVVRAVMHSDLKIVDPVWTTAYISRNHGYMIYDTLFSTDAQGAVQPQMIDTYQLSEDKTVYTMTLRDGLLWHDGQPVTSEDCIASIKRWAARDVVGQAMMAHVKDFVAVDQNGGPIQVPELVPETEEEIQRFEGALRRKQLSLIIAGKMKASEATELKKLFLE